MNRELRALLYLRWTRLVRRTRRRLDNLKAYLHWQAVLVYLYAGVIFLGSPLYHLALPWLLPDTVRFGGGLLLVVLLAGYLLLSGYSALFGAADGFPGQLPVGDVRFILTSPISQRAFLGDRLLWGLLQTLGQAALLFPLSWFLGRALLPPWGAAEAAMVTLLYAAVQMGVKGTGLLFYGLPTPVTAALRWLRTALRLLTLLLGVGALACWRGLPLASGVALPVQGLALPASAVALGAAAEAVIGLLLPPSVLWAAAAWLLAFASFRPEGARLAGDLLLAEQRRIATATGDATAHWESGVAKTSLRSGWGTGMWALVWRQLAAYRHQPAASWPPILLSLLGGAAAPWLAVSMLPWALEAAAGMPLLMPVLMLTRTTSALAGAWRGELRHGQTRYLLPVTAWHLLVGYAFWPAVAAGLAVVTGTVWVGLSAGWPPAMLASACLLALAASALAAVLALHEAYMTETALTGSREGQQQAMMASLVLAGLPIILLATGILPLWGASTLLMLGVLVAAEALALLWYMALQLRRYDR